MNFDRIWAMKTYGQLLEETQKAIETLLNGGQEYELNGRRLRRADLQWLYEREREMMRKVEAHGPNAFPGSNATRIKAGVQFV